MSGDMPGTRSALATTVLAAADVDQPHSALHLEQLSVYSTPRIEVRAVAPEPGPLESGVGNARKTVEPYAAWFQDAYGTVRPGVHNVARIGRETCAYLKHPPDYFYARAGVIAFAGVLGLLLARRSRVKRLVYPAGLAAVTAALYYPDTAAAIGRSGSSSVYDWALQGYVTVERLLKAENKPEGNSSDAGSAPVDKP